MKNISFDNPYWLFMAIPLVLLILIPYFISKNKDNKTRGWLTSLVFHVLIACAVTLAAAGLTHTTVMTRTKVYIVADVSYSSERNLDKIDEYIANIADSLPPNTKLGIVCFGNDSTILTSSGTAIKSVKDAKVDASGTNIAGALDETASYFSEGELKRIILITDGFDTTADGSTAAAVERLAARNIRIDTIYLDNNLKEGEAETQVSDVDYTPSTYVDQDSSISVLVEANVENDVIVSLSVQPEGESSYTQISQTVLHADIGMNIATFTLPTNVAGVFDYKVELQPTADFSAHNNAYSFTQTVAAKRSILLITGQRNDQTEIERLYGESVDIDPYLINNSNKDIPYTIEALSQYDEIILSNVDIREINNINAFIDSVDIAVSQYGKSLITMGDLYMQNKDDPVFERLEELLPVSFGNANKDSKLYTIVLDISRSMYSNRPAKLLAAKDAATKLVSILDDEDTVALIIFAGEAVVIHTPERLGDCREKLYSKIQSAEASQGTLISDALQQAYKLMKDLDYEEKQVMLISDGKSFAEKADDEVIVAQKMKNADIILSGIAVPLNLNQISDKAGCATIEELTKICGGLYYELRDESKVSELVFAEIGDKITDSIMEGKVDVNIETYRDPMMEGIGSLPPIYGYINTKPKLDATMILSVDYEKNSSTTVSVPLYSYRNHGNGKVATFTSSISGNWLKDWSYEDKDTFFGNLLSTNTPPERIDYPFELKFEHYGSKSSVEISPSYLNPKAKTYIKITDPAGRVSEQQLVFDLNKYSTEFATSLVGKYKIEITYAYGTHSFSSVTYYTIPYAMEYNAFAAYDISDVYDFMRGAGQISTDGTLDLENDKSYVSTYELSFRVPLLIFAVALFVVDVFIRKFRWKDIKGFFHKKKKGAR